MGKIQLNSRKFKKPMSLARFARGRREHRERLESKIFLVFNPVIDFPLCSLRALANGVSGRETVFCFFVYYTCLLYFYSKQRLPAIGESRHVDPVNDQVLPEHCKGSHPTGKVAVKAAVYDHKFFRFAMAGHRYDFIIFPFVVAVPPRSDFLWPLIHQCS